MSSPAISTPPAIERALELFEPERRPAEANLTDGYLDLLGEHDPTGEKLSQQAMLGKLAPRIYESLSRPLVMRVGMRGPSWKVEYALAMEMLAVKSGERVLDLACGPGNFTRGFAASAGSGLVVGLDASRPMLTAAVQRTPNANVAYMRGDASAPPFRDACWDAISCLGALHLFERPTEALEAMVRMLVPGGRLALMVTCDPKATGRREPPVRKYGGIIVFTREDITGALADHGLIDIAQQVKGRAQFVSARKPAAGA
ncbi:MAG TPA: methyltransferase domain-containing protein [Solirubrobacteraceae bacterium]